MSDDMVNCPYDIAHRMLRKRLQQHLIKCRLNYPDTELVKCPYNQIHMIPEPEYEIHLSHCPDRKVITQYRYESGAPIKNDDVLHERIECDDNWDDDECEDYNPQQYASTANIVRQPDGFFPAERKEFVMKERERLEGIVNTSSDSMPPTPPPPTLTPEDAMQMSTGHRRIKHENLEPIEDIVKKENNQPSTSDFSASSLKPVGSQRNNKNKAKNSNYKHSSNRHAPYDKKKNTK